MLGSNILDIVIGMTFIFLLLSLVCSADNELIENFVKAREWRHNSSGASSLP